MSLIRQNKIEDATDNTRLLGINASGEATVKDTDLTALVTTGNATLLTINTSIGTNTTAINTNTTAVEDVETSVDETTAAVTSLEAQGLLGLTEVIGLLGNMQKELKKMNLHMMILTDTHITNKEVG